MYMFFIFILCCFQFSNSAWHHAPRRFLHYCSILRFCMKDNVRALIHTTSKKQPPIQLHILPISNLIIYFYCSRQNICSITNITHLNACNTQRLKISYNSRVEFFKSRGPYMWQCCDCFWLRLWLWLKSCFSLLRIMGNGKWLSMCSGLGLFFFLFFSSHFYHFDISIYMYINTIYRNQL